MQFDRCFGCMEELSGEQVCPRCGYSLNSSGGIAGEIRPGTILGGQYVVGKSLAKFPDRTVYIGWDLNLNMKVEIIESVSSDPQKKAEEQGVFSNEAKILAKLSNISQLRQIRNFITGHGTAYMVLEYLEGIALGDMVTKKGRLGERETFSLMEPILWALAAIHREGLIHRRVGMQSLFYIPEEGRLRLEGPAEPRWSPISEETPGPWTDVYAVCRVIYFCLTMSYPAGGSLSGLSLSGSRASALEAGLSTDPARRPRTIEELYRSFYGKELDPQKPEAERIALEIAEDRPDPLSEEGHPAPCEKKRGFLEKLKGEKRIFAGAAAALLACIVLGFSGMFPKFASTEKDVSAERDVSAEEEPETESLSNPSGRDYMRGNTSSNLANGGRFLAVDEEKGIYLATDTVGKLYKGTLQGFQLLYNGRIEGLNVWDGFAWFYAEAGRIYRLDLETDDLTVLAEDIKAYDLFLVNDSLIFRNADGIWRMDPDSGEMSALYEASEEDRISGKMVVENSRVFFLNGNELYAFNYEKGESPQPFYTDEKVYRVRGWNERIYADIGDRILEMDYDGSQTGEIQADFVPESNFLGIYDGWMYFDNFEENSIMRYSLDTQEEETLVTGLYGSPEMLNISGGVAWFLIFDASAEMDKYEAYSFNLDGETWDLEDCYVVDDGIQAGI